MLILGELPRGRWGCMAPRRSPGHRSCERHDRHEGQRAQQDRSRCERDLTGARHLSRERAVGRWRCRCGIRTAGRSAPRSGSTPPRCRARVDEPVETMSGGVELRDHVAELRRRNVAGGGDPLRQRRRRVSPSPARARTATSRPGLALVVVGSYSAGGVDVDIDLAALSDRRHVQVAGVQDETVDAARAVPRWLRTMLAPARDSPCETANASPSQSRYWHRTRPTGAGGAVAVDAAGRPHR